LGPVGPCGPISPCGPRGPGGPRGPYSLLVSIKISRPSVSTLTASALLLIERNNIERRLL
jgi:hypothetical protein